MNWFPRVVNCSGAFKYLCKFMVFDIKEFYPSITENLLKKALTFAQAHTLPSDDDKAIICYARKT